MKRGLFFIAAALGMLIPGACGKDNPEKEVEQVDLKELLFANSEIKRGLSIQSTAMKREQLSDDELRELLMQRKIRSREARVSAYRASGRVIDADKSLSSRVSAARVAGSSPI